MKKILLALLLVCAGCEDQKSSVTTTAGQAPTLYGPFLLTAEHDGHKFVVAYKHATGSANGGVSMLHHPDCSCTKR